MHVHTCNLLKGIEAVGEPALLYVVLSMLSHCGSQPALLVHHQSTTTELSHHRLLQSLPTGGRAESEDEGEVPHDTRALGACPNQPLTTPKQRATAKLTPVAEPASSAETSTKDPCYYIYIRISQYCSVYIWDMQVYVYASTVCVFVYVHTALNWHTYILCNTYYHTVLPAHYCGQPVHMCLCVNFLLSC